MSNNEPLRAKKVQVYEPLVRQWCILRLITKHRFVTIRHLTLEYHCSEETIHRDLATLTAAGFPIETHRAEVLDGPIVIRMRADWFLKYEPIKYNQWKGYKP